MVKFKSYKVENVGLFDILRYGDTEEQCMVVRYKDYLYFRADAEGMEDSMRIKEEYDWHVHIDKFKKIVELVEKHEPVEEYSGAFMFDTSDMDEGVILKTGWVRFFAPCGDGAFVKIKDLRQIAEALCGPGMGN